MAEARKLRYVGPFDAVDVPAIRATVKRNHQVEVADRAIADSLLAQADWEEVGTPKSQQKPAAEDSKQGG